MKERTVLGLDLPVTSKGIRSLPSSDDLPRPSGLQLATSSSTSGWYQVSEDVMWATVETDYLAHVNYCRGTLPSSCELLFKHTTLDTNNTNYTMGTITFVECVAFKRSTASVFKTIFPLRGLHSTIALQCWAVCNM